MAGLTQSDWVKMGINMAGVVLAIVVANAIIGGKK